jgi:hypothetical protein
VQSKKKKGKTRKRFRPISPVCMKIIMYRKDEGRMWYAETADGRVKTFGLGHDAAITNCLRSLGFEIEYPYGQFGVKPS